MIFKILFKYLVESLTWCWKSSTQINPSGYQFELTSQAFRPSSSYCGFRETALHLSHEFHFSEWRSPVKSLFGCVQEFWRTMGPKVPLSTGSSYCLSHMDHLFDDAHCGWIIWYPPKTLLAWKMHVPRISRYPAFSTSFQLVGWTVDSQDLPIFKHFQDISGPLPTPIRLNYWTMVQTCAELQSWCSVLPNASELELPPNADCPFMFSYFRTPESIFGSLSYNRSGIFHGTIFSHIMERPVVCCALK